MNPKSGVTRMLRRQKRQAARRRRGCLRADVLGLEGRKVIFQCKQGHTWKVALNEQLAWLAKHYWLKNGYCYAGCPKCIKEDYAQIDRELGLS